MYQWFAKSLLDILQKPKCQFAELEEKLVAQGLDVLALTGFCCGICYNALMTSESTEEASVFYNSIADAYDSMFTFDSRLKSAQEFVAALGQRVKAAVAVDVGCGTGAYSLALAMAGIRTIAADVSEAMLAKAHANASELGVQIECKLAGLEELADAIPCPVDMIVCMGNTLPHLLTPESLASALDACRAILNPGGHLVLQLLNYERVLARRERVIGVSRDGAREFVRFYDFIDPLIQFNLIELDWSTSEPQSRLSGTTLFPYTSEQLRSALADHGFGEIELFGGLDFGPYDSESSETLLVLCIT